MSDPEMTWNDLRDLLRAAAGEPEGIDLADDDLVDVNFADMGYDSLALLETSGRIEREYGISLTDSLVSDYESPRDLLAAINAVLAGDQAA